MAKTDCVMTQTNKKALLTQLKNARKAIEKGDFSEIDGSKFSDELLELIDEFNELLSAQNASQTRYLASLSHVSTNIMIADPNFDIVYMNDSIL